MIEIQEPVGCAMRGRYTKDEYSATQQIEIRRGGVSNTITTVSKDYLLIEPQILKMKRTEEEKYRRHLYGDVGAKFSQSKQYEPATNGCSNTMLTVTKDNLLMAQETKRKYRIRKLIPRECGRLMGVRDNTIDLIENAGISESQQYKMYGNSIVVDTLVNGIFKNLFINTDKPSDTLF